MRQGRMIGLGAPVKQSSPPPSKNMMPSHRRLQPCSGWPTALARDGAVEAEPMRHRGGFYPAGHAQLGQDVRHVHAGCLCADEQGLADLGVGPAGREQGQDLAFALGEPEPGQRVRRQRGGRRPVVGDRVGGRLQAQPSPSLGGVVSRSSTAGFWSAGGWR
jgi:hypothetical protein